MVLLVSVGSLVITLMSHSGQHVSRRCVVVFALLFIPAHILVIGTVLPLLWLSVWNLALLGLVNMVCILTGAWIILQFLAFRKEDPALCITIEQGLFALYPCVCCAVVVWVMATVLPGILLPFAFLFLWFVHLQLYLTPAPSSFKQGDGQDDDDLIILQPPIVIAIVIAFIISGPALHVILALAGSSSASSLSFLTLLCMLLCLGVFLSTLLSLRQLCEYVGVTHQVIVHVRWASGGGVVLLVYPVLQCLGVESHFLFSLPLAVVGFAALGLTLSLKSQKIVPQLLMVGLMMMLSVWLYQLPWALSYVFLLALPLTMFNLLVGVNFVLCVLAIFAAWHGSKESFGALLLLQSAAMTVCESGLYNSSLYTLSIYQLVGAVTAYTLHRLYIANKITRNTSTLASALQLTKAVTGTLGYIAKQGLRSGQGGETMMIGGMLDFVTLLPFVGVLLWLFVYETKDVVTFSEMRKHLALLLVTMAINIQSLLVPVGQLILQGDPTSADIVGLWFGVGGVLVLLYTLQHGQGRAVKEQLVRGAVVMVVTGALVTAAQPSFQLSLLSLFQWSEVLSLLLTAVILVSTTVDLSLTHTLTAAGLLALCPGTHAAWLLYGEGVTIVHCVLISLIACCMLAFLLLTVKATTLTHTTERCFKIGAVSLAVLLGLVFVVDVTRVQTYTAVWTLPTWTLAFTVTLCVSVLLKLITLKHGAGHLPLAGREDKTTPVLPLLGNMATVSAFFLARTQGPQDILLHDLWCCASSMLLILLQRDSLLLSSLSKNNQTSPTILAAVTSLFLSTLSQSRLWQFGSTGSMLLGSLEVVNLLFSLPVYVVLAGILWEGQIWSEKAVVFTMPLNAFVFLLGSSYTAWALCVAGFVCGLTMMVWRLPLLPYQPDPFT